MSELLHVEFRHFNVNVPEFRVPWKRNSVFRGNGTLCSVETEFRDKFLWNYGKESAEFR